jgi:hypothetical protein
MLEFLRRHGDVCIDSQDGISHQAAKPVRTMLEFLRRHGDVCIDSQDGISHRAAKLVRAIRKLVGSR